MTANMPLLNILRYFFLSLMCLVVGAFVGCMGGLGLGWLLALGYEKQGPSDPGDAPAYVGLGLMLMGGFLGAIAGLIIGIILCVRLARRNVIRHSQ